MELNTTIELIKNHTSIRKFTDKKISKTKLNHIIDAAISASSSCFFQCISIIHVTEISKRKELVKLSGNKNYVSESSDFLLFCIDYARHKTIAPEVNFGNIERIINASIDAGIIGQNALLAAQSLGLGGVFIGGIRNNPKPICNLLGLPAYVFPLMGLCLGYPDQNPEKKPRLPKEILIHKDHYQKLDMIALKKYDLRSKSYYQNRSSNNKNQTWTSNISEKLTKEERPFMSDALKSQMLYRNLDE